MSPSTDGASPGPLTRSVLSAQVKDRLLHDEPESRLQGVEKVS
jgi:hypothetical protein